MARTKRIDKASEIARINELRTTAVMEAFAFLEQRHPFLTRLLLRNLGSRPQAAHWMCVYRRSLGGKSAHEALEDGNESGVLKEISHATRQWDAATLLAARTAY